MGLFSADKSSSSSVSNVTNTRNSPTSLQDVQTQGFVQSGITYDAGGAITVTDSGAIQRIYDTAVAAMQSSNDALSYAERASNSALSFAADAGRPTESITKQQSYIVLGIVVSVAIAAAVVFSRN